MKDFRLSLLHKSLYNPLLFFSSELDCSFVFVCHRLERLHRKDGVHGKKRLTTYIGVRKGSGRNLRRHLVKYP